MAARRKVGGADAEEKIEALQRAVDTLTEHVLFIREHLIGLLHVEELLAQNIVLIREHAAVLRKSDEARNERVARRHEISRARTPPLSSAWGGDKGKKKGDQK